MWFILVLRGVVTVGFVLLYADRRVRLLAQAWPIAIVAAIVSEANGWPWAGRARVALVSFGRIAWRIDAADRIRGSGRPDRVGQGRIRSFLPRVMKLGDPSSPLSQRRRATIRQRPGPISPLSGVHLRVKRPLSRMRTKPISTAF